MVTATSQHLRQWFWLDLANKNQRICLSDLPQGEKGFLDGL
jgi:hypothetical protein